MCLSWPETTFFNMFSKAVRDSSLYCYKMCHQNWDTKAFNTFEDWYNNWQLFFQFFLYSIRSLTTHAGLNKLTAHWNHNKLCPRKRKIFVFSFCLLKIIFMELGFNRNIFSTIRRHERWRTYVSREYGSVAGNHKCSYTQNTIDLKLTSTSLSVVILSELSLLFRRDIVCTYHELYKHVAGPVLRNNLNTYIASRYTLKYTSCLTNLLSIHIVNQYMDNDKQAEEVALISIAV